MLEGGKDGNRYSKEGFIYMKIKMVGCVQKSWKEGQKVYAGYEGLSQLFKVYAGYEGLSQLFKAHKEQESVRWCIWY